MTNWKTCELVVHGVFDHEANFKESAVSSDFPVQYRVYSAPCFVIDPSSGKGTSLSAAMSMSSLVSSLATNAEHLYGQSTPLESSIVQTLQNTTLKLLVIFINLFFAFYCWCEMPVGCS